jgi:hypothetical protein
MIRIPALLLLGTLALPAASAQAVCPEHRFTQSGDVRLAGDAVLIVTHASSNDDGRAATKLGVDEAVRFAKSRRIPVVYLQDGRPAENYFMDDCKPDYWVNSEGGEIGFDISPSQVYAVGGHLEECLAATLNDVLLNWARQPARNLTITYVMDGIFSNGKSIEPTDRYYKSLNRFMGIVAYNKPAGEHYQKLSLLETMGLIIDERLQYEYLQRILPRYDRTMSPNYRVELKLMDSRTRILQAGKGRRPPVLRFEFVDSAITLENAGSFPAGML